MNNTFTVDFSQGIALARENQILDKPFKTPNGFASYAVYTRNSEGQVVRVDFNAQAAENSSHLGPRYLSQYWAAKVDSAKASESRTIGLNNLADFYADESKINPAYEEWDGYSFYNEADLLRAKPSLKNAPSIFTLNVMKPKETRIGSDTQFNSQVKEKLDSVMSR